MLSSIIYPPFIYKHCAAAALFILILFMVSFGFMLSSSEKSFEDINQDGTIGWNEIYVAWKLPGTVHWWKYLFGILFGAWAVLVSARVYNYDQALQRAHVASMDKKTVV